MQGNLFLQPIKILHINILLYAVILWLVIQYHGPMRWAMQEIPKYQQSIIGSPIERSLYLQAMSSIKNSGYNYITKELLQKSLSIDPNTHARFYLGKYYKEHLDYDKALQHFKSYLAIDPTVVITYIEIVSIYEQQNKLNDAKQILQQGFEYFDKYSSRFKPSSNKDVEDKYNKAAEEVYIHYLKARSYFKNRLKAYENKSNVLNQ